MSANEELRSLSIRHGVYLERYTRNEALRLSRLLEAAVKQLEERIFATNGAITRERLNNLVANARDLLTQATRAATGQLSTDMDELARYELDRALADLRSAIPSEITTVGIAPEQALSAIRAFPATEGFLMNDLFERWGRNTVDAFTTQIRLGVLEGDTVNQIVQRIRGRVVRRATSTRPGVYEGGVVGTSTRGAEALARTAVAHVNNTVRDEIYKANEDIIKGYQYVATLDSATCLVCAPLDGKVYETGEAVPMLPQHYNCLPGDTLISASSDIAAISVRLYKGDMVVIRTASGNVITATPNHPILTGRGFIHAERINETDCLFCDGGINRTKLAGIDNQNMQASIEKVAGAFLKSSKVCAMVMPATAKDFHGDAINNEITIIAADRSLLRKSNIEINQFVSKGIFINRSLASLMIKSSKSAFSNFIIGMLSAFAGLMRCAGKICNFLWSRSCHTGKLLLARISSFNSSLFKGNNDVHSASAQFFSDSTNSNSGIINSKHFANCWPVSTRSTTIQSDAGIAQDSVDDIFGNTRLACQIASGNAGPVLLDNVVSISKYNFSGHVYNLQTKLGWFIANGIITHNCRCLLVPVTKSYKELGLDIDEIAPGTRSSMNGYVPEKTTYQEWLAGQPAAIQNDILGPGRADLFRSGTTLSDMRDRAGNVVTLERLRELDK